MSEKSGSSVPQIDLFGHFSEEGHHGFVENIRVIVIDKLIGRDRTRESFRLHKLDTFTSRGLNVEEVDPLYYYLFELPSLVYMYSLFILLFYFMSWFLFSFSYASLYYCLCSPFSYYISLLSISCFLGHIGFPFHFKLHHTHFVLAWFSLYPGGTVGISFSKTLLSYANC